MHTLSSLSEVDACAVGCKTCTGDTCFTCSEGYHLDGHTCVKCPKSNCKTCDSYLCQSCSQGFWGSSCVNPCGTGCLNGSCDFNKGECQCKDGVYCTYCWTECRQPCAKCTDWTSCTSCPVGKYTATCQQPCKSTCIDGSCDIYTGECINNEKCPSIVTIVLADTIVRVVSLVITDQHVKCPV
ncbi:hypothetical protein DPMN_015554 [Dreissena polymorpha]|uniref:EGF-like domain-containing protein n=1 Tax=Dreissena polymorpha TaxID=45954 RepID=A0A9D4S697_DREPO|nr:hypothetical protein DPMN_015554 [Dreissena polymorpha]